MAGAGGGRWDTDGAMVKRMAVSVLQDMGWAPRIPLREGLERTFAWFRTQPAIRG
jgi:GDP-L-fucose synthase